MTSKDKKIKYFKNRVNYYFFDIFHLQFFELNIEEQVDPDVRASTFWHNIDEGSNMINICYSIDWIENKNLTYTEIDKVAFHEVCEALLSEVQQLMTYRFISKKDIPNAIHRIIRILENTIFEKIKDKK
jgi:hypothetical protein